MPYSNSNGIRDCEAVLAEKNTDGSYVYSSQELEAFAADYADPVIDAALLAAGYSVPIETSTAPKIIAAVSAMLAASRAIQSKAGRRTGSTVERATELRTEAMALLDGIRKGTLDPGISRSTTAEPVIYDTDPETRHEHAAVVGVNAEDWTNQAETTA